MPYTITTPLDGLRVLTIPNDQEIASVAIYCDMGAARETEEENGLSHFFEHMVFKGTPTRTAFDIASDMEIDGTETNAFTAYDMTCYFGNCLSSNINSTLEVLADAVRNSIFADEDVALERNVVCQEIAKYNDDLDAVAYYGLLEMIYPDQPAGREILGTEERVQGFTSDDLRKFVNDNYHANNLIVACTGKVDHEEFSAKVVELFNGHPTGETREVVPAVFNSAQKVITKADTEQAQIYIAYELPNTSPHSREHATNRMVNYILGGGMSSPLFSEVRENRGLCYSVYSFVGHNRSGSFFGIGGGTTPENTEEFIRVASEQLVRVANGEFTETDHTRALNTFKVMEAKATTRAKGNMDNVVQSIFWTGQVVTPQERMAQLESITREEIIQAAKAIVASKRSIILAGNADPETDYLSMVA